MSMRSSFVYGYGFKLYCNGDEEKIVEFIKAHKDTFCKSDSEKEIYSYLLKFSEKQNNQNDLEDYFANYECEYSGCQGIEAAISNIMQRETGIRFEYQCGDENCDNYPSIILREGYPWQYNEVEKSLTEKDLSHICKKYMDELGIYSEPNYVNIEYYG